ncbi:MAG: hypothetical protein AAF843_11175, partial [Bacteroidota bacterium]
EVKETIKDIPVGARLQLIKKNGAIVEVRLASHEVTSIAKKDYGEIVVPELPPALIVRGRSRFGNFRQDIDELVKIAWIED